MSNEPKKIMTVDRFLILGILIVQAYIIFAFINQNDDEQHGTSANEEITIQPDKEQIELRLPNPSAGTKAPNSQAQQELQDMNSIFEEMHREMNSMMKRAHFDFDRIDRLMSLDSHWDEIIKSPTLDLKEQADSYIVTMSIPGLDPNDIDIEIRGRLLTVKGRYETESPAGKRSQEYENRILLPTGVDKDTITKEVTDKGILKITIHKQINSKGQTN